MTFSVNQDMNATSQIAESANFPGIRMLTVDTDVSTTPLSDIRRVKYKSDSSWLVSQPSSFGTALFGYPSAICYYFAKNLYTHFNGSVPIGIISSSVGGSGIEFWQSDAARADTTCGGLNFTSSCMSPTATTAVTTATTETITETITDTTATATADVDVSGWTPSCFYNAMIHPFGAMALRGVVWDQGEANADDSCEKWGCKLGALAKDWRENLFQNPKMLMTFDQLVRTGKNW